MDFKTIKETDSLYSMRTYNRFPVCWVSGTGCKLYDSNGKEYTDFLAGLAVNSLGYGDPELTQAIAVQASKLMHTSNLFYSEENAELSKLLTEGSDFSKVFLCNSGAEANECAIKLTRKYFNNYLSPRKTIITAVNSFHGRTLATVTATGQTKYSAPFAPLPEGFKHVPFGDIDALNEELNSGNVAAFMIETIQGEGGVVPASYEYLTTAYAMCKAKGALFIVDEIQTGMGRTGKMFSYEHFGITPDIITLAKGLGGGVPIGAVLARGDAAECFVPGDHGTTFGGNPLAAKAAAVVVKRLKSPGFLDNVSQTGEYFKAKLTELKAIHSVIDVRGKGLLLGLQLNPDIKGAEIVGKMLSAGYVINCCGGNTLRFCPPLIISKREIDGMIAALGKLLKSI